MYRSLKDILTFQVSSVASVSVTLCLNLIIKITVFL